MVIHCLPISVKLAACLVFYKELSFDALRLLDMCMALLQLFLTQYMNNDIRFEYIYIHMNVFIW